MNSDLTNADFSNANLTGAILTGALLLNTNLITAIGVNLTQQHHPSLSPLSLPSPPHNQPEPELQNIYDYTTIPPIPIEKYNETIEIKNNTSAFDPINYEERLISQLLNEEPNVKIIFFNNYYYAVYQITLNNEFILSNTVFECFRANSSLSVENLNLKDGYFKAKSIGIQSGVIPNGKMKSFINSEDRFFIIKETDKNLASTVSFDVYFVVDDLTSGSHCQKGQDAKVYDIISFQPKFITEEPVVSEPTTKKRKLSEGGFIKKSKIKSIKKNKKQNRKTKHKRIS
jgi:hypothetical protein